MKLAFKPCHRRAVQYRTPLWRWGRTEAADPRRQTCISRFDRAIDISMPSARPSVTMAVPP